MCCDTKLHLQECLLWTWVHRRADGRRSQCSVRSPLLRPLRILPLCHSSSQAHIRRRSHKPLTAFARSTVVNCDRRTPWDHRPPPKDLALKKVGTVVCCDLLDLECVPGATFVQGDFLLEEVRHEVCLPPPHITFFSSLAPSDTPLRPGHGPAPRRNGRHCAVRYGAKHQRAWGNGPLSDPRAL